MTGRFPEVLVSHNPDSIFSSPVVIGERISPREVIPTLDLTKASKRVRASVQASAWYRIQGGSIILECRNPDILGELDGEETVMMDMDDCLLSASGWHRREYQLIESSQELRDRGIRISSEQARAVYEASKILTGSMIEKEPRYTPGLNLALLTDLSSRLEHGEGENRAWEEVFSVRDDIVGQIQAHGEDVLAALPVDPLIRGIFIDNSPADFVYTDFTRRVLGRTLRDDIRIIATRGTIGGVLGQVDKVHRSGLIGISSKQGRRLDGVLYFNDVKADVLRRLGMIIPGSQEGLIRIYDDNPAEVGPFLAVASELKANNIEVVRVAHPDAKRKDVLLPFQPNLIHTLKRLGTILQHFSPSALLGLKAATT